MRQANSKMKLREIKELLQAEVISGDDCLDEEIAAAGASDLMSDVLAFGKPGILLLTGLSNAQSVRTANIIDAKAIIYVRGKKPDKEGVDLAKEKSIPLLSTKFMMYKACGLLFSHGLQGIVTAPLKNSHER
jgi:predicted transcriptional regulator